MSVHIDDLIDYIEASPTPFHCVAATQAKLKKAGFTQLDERSSWSLERGAAYYLIRDGAIVAFRVGSKAVGETGLRIIGAHTDSPNLRIKPNADVYADGYAQLGVEVYGGNLTYTWLDRDLGLAGRVMVGKSPEQISAHLIRIDEAILRIPSLCIHLNRGYRDKGLKLNRQTHLSPMWAVGDESEDSLLKQRIAEELQVSPEDILAFELSLFDLQKPAVGGLHKDQVFSARLDNQAMCHAGLCALLDSEGSATTTVLSLYDHEEVGSESMSGAGGSLLEDLVARLCVSPVAGDGMSLRETMLSASFQLSADMAHAVHPNYSEMHEAQHHPKLNGGPVIKVNANQRYASTAEGVAVVKTLCNHAEVSYQEFVNRTDLGCGSTIGPVSSARLGIRTVDLGNAMLSMHSIREQCGTKDHASMVSVMKLFLEAEGI